MIRAPPVTPPEARLASASDATLVPAVDFHVTAPRIGYITEAESIAAAAASEAEVSKCTPSSPSTSLRVGQHVHQVRDRRALVAADIADARLQQRLGDGQDAFAAERVAIAESEILDFASERPFSHDAFLPERFQAKWRPVRSEENASKA